MQATAQTYSVSKTMLWTGRILSALPVLMLLFAGGMKLTQSPAIVQSMGQYGYPSKLVLVVGILEVVCAVIYAIPRTAILGAILMTGFLGGATASNVRIGNASWLITIALGILVWAGLYLRDQRLRALIPLRRNA